MTDDALTRATPQIDAFRRALAQFPALGTGLALYVYARGPGSDIRARMFAPLGGTFEDPATGSAATPLAALLLSLGDAAEARYDIAQGVEMRRPACCAPRRGARPTASTPGSAATASRCCAARRMCS